MHFLEPATLFAAATITYNISLLFDKSVYGTTKDNVNNSVFAAIVFFAIDEPDGSPIGIKFDELNGLDEL